MNCFSLSLLVLGTTGLFACAAPRGDGPAGDDPPPPAGDDFESCIPAADNGPIFKETLTLSGENGALLVRIVRRPGDGPTIGETFALQLLGFAMQEGGELTACVTDPAALSYVYEHHNWDDQAIAEASPSRTLTLSMTYDVVTSTWTDVLDDSSTDEDVVLATDACASEGPSPANGCFRR